MKTLLAFAIILLTACEAAPVPVAQDPGLGTFARFNTGMNIHSIEGRRLVSDIRLPEVPTGRDDTHLYVVDYGREVLLSARGPTGAESRRPRFFRDGPKGRAACVLVRSAATIHRPAGKPAPARVANAAGRWRVRISPGPQAW